LENLSTMSRRFLHSLTAALSLVAVTGLTACGGGSGNTGSTIGPTPKVNNTAPLVVDAGPSGAGAVNTLYTTVKICQHGSTSHCQTIDHVQVDTGSVGLRVLSGALTLSGLTPETDAAGNNLLECAQFADGYAWGPIAVADVTIGGLTASAVPIQIIGEAAYAGWEPAACSTGLTAENTVADFGANALLGIGPFLQDCGSNCASTNTLPTASALYYTCVAARNCTQVAVATSTQVLNPVALFPQDNNGIAIQLPAVTAPGAVSATGTLYFGIATEDNNGLGAGVRLLALDGTGAFADTAYNGQHYPNTSFIDSGSNAYYFPDATIPTCANAEYARFYCPGATVALSASIVGQGTNPNTAQIAFVIDDAATLFTKYTSYNLLPSLAGPAGALATFDWGLPFFYGRTTFEAFENATVSNVSSAGPWVGW
jgi:Protein of unknown function (DUF3443)